jgi:hypothetical protein
MYCISKENNPLTLGGRWWRGSKIHGSRFLLSTSHNFGREVGFSKIHSSRFLLSTSHMRTHFERSVNTWLSVVGVLKEPEDLIH